MIKYPEIEYLSRFCAATKLPLFQNLKQHFPPPHSYISHITVPYLILVPCRITVSLLAIFTFYRLYLDICSLISVNNLYNSKIQSRFIKSGYFYPMLAKKLFGRPPKRYLFNEKNLMLSFFSLELYSKDEEGS